MMSSMSSKYRDGRHGRSHPLRTPSDGTSGGPSTIPGKPVRATSNDSNETAVSSDGSEVGFTPRFRSSQRVRDDMSVKTAKIANLSLHKRGSDDATRSVKTAKAQNLSSHSRSAHEGQPGSCHSREPGRLTPAPKPRRPAAPSIRPPPRPPREDHADEATCLSDRKQRSIAVQDGDDKPIVGPGNQMPSTAPDQLMVPILSDSQRREGSETEQSFDDEDSEMSSTHHHCRGGTVASNIGSEIPLGGDLSVVMGHRHCQQDRTIERRDRQLQVIAKFLFFIGALLQLLVAVQKLDQAKTAASATGLVATKQDDLVLQDQDAANATTTLEYSEYRQSSGGARALHPDCNYTTWPAEPRPFYEPRPFVVRSNSALESNTSEAGGPAGDAALGNERGSSDPIDLPPTVPATELGNTTQDEAPDTEYEDDSGDSTYETQKALLPPTDSTFSILATIAMFAASLCFALAGLMEWIRDRLVFHIFLFTAGLFGLFYAMLVGVNGMGSLVSNSIAAHCFLLEALSMSYWNRRNPKRTTNSIPDASSTISSSNAATTRGDALFMADIFFVLGALISTTVSYINYSDASVRFHSDIGVLVSGLWAIYAMIYMISIISKPSLE